MRDKLTIAYGLSITAMIVTIINMAVSIGVLLLTLNYLDEQRRANEQVEVTMNKMLELDGQIIQVLEGKVDKQ